MLQLEILQGTNAALTVPGSCESATSFSYPDDFDGIQSLLAAHIHRLDNDLVEPDASLRELRCRYPRTFTSLIAGYLGFLDFEASDLFRIAEEVGKQEFSRAVKKNSGCSAAARYALGSPITRSVFTPAKLNGILTGWGKQPRGKTTFL